MKKMLVACLWLVIILSACGPVAPRPSDFPTPPSPSPLPPATEVPAPVKATEVPIVAPMATEAFALPLTPVSGEGYPGVVFKAREALAAKLGLSADQITVVNIEPIDWSDGCLGVSNPEVMCIMVITPGYRVILRANGKDYEVHTDTRSAVVFTRQGPPFGP